MVVKEIGANPGPPAWAQAHNRSRMPGGDRREAAELANVIRKERFMALLACRGIAAHEGRAIPDEGHGAYALERHAGARR